MEPTKHQGPNSAICDFCSNPDVAWAYPCDDFCVFAPDGDVHDYKGAWAACEQCHKLLQIGDKQALLERSYNQLFVNYPMQLALPAEYKLLTKATIAFLQDQFFKHRR